MAHRLYEINPFVKSGLIIHDPPARLGPAAAASKDPKENMTASSLDWADSHRAVVAVAPGPGDPRLPAFAAPLVHQPVAALLQGFAANTGYQVRTEGPAYDLDHVLMVGQVRLSCAEARRG